MKVMKSKFFKILVSISLVVALLSASNIFFIVGAESVTDLEEEADRLDQIIKDNEELLNSIKGDITKQSDYVNAINEQLSAMNEKVSLLNARVDEINSSISALNSQIEDVNNQITQTQAEAISKLPGDKQNFVIEAVKGNNYDSDEITALVLEVKEKRPSYRSKTKQ